MADKPILFSAPMVRALLASTKTQTRRAIPEKLQDAYFEYDDWCSNVSAGVPTSRQWEREFFLERIRIKTGDRLYVREAWRTISQYDGVAPRDLEPFTRLVEFVADGAGTSHGKFRQAMHMPRWASRLTLTVTDVRVERLQGVSDADARAEGIEQRYGFWRCYGETPLPFRGAAPTVLSQGRGVVSADPIHSYSTLWDSINGAGAWDANPWVVAYTFTVHHHNIDQVQS